jgi:hypothetical protein
MRVRPGEGLLDRPHEACRLRVGGGDLGGDLDGTVEVADAWQGWSHPFGVDLDDLYDDERVGRRPEALSDRREGDLNVIGHHWAELARIYR